MPHDDVATAARDEGAETIPLMKETVTTGKRLVETIGARVHVTVSEHEETVNQLLARQDVRVEHVHIGTVVTETPPVRREGEVIIVPVMEEVLVVEKRLVLREELRIHITEVREARTETVTLRREHANVDADPTQAINPGDAA